MPANPFGPCVYYVSPIFFCDDRVDDKLCEVLSLGFTHICTAPIFKAGRRSNIFLSSTFERVADPLAEQGLANTAAAWIERKAEVCRRHQLDLLVDVVLGRLSDDATIPELENCFVQPSGPDIVDPRYFDTLGSSSPRWGDPAIEDSVIACYARMLKTLAASGASGFRFVAASEVPALVWNKLLANIRQDTSDCLFIADVEGVEPVAIERLAGCGFDAFQSSLAGWDYRTSDRITFRAASPRPTPVLWAVETPFGRRLAAGVGEHGRLAAQRALDIAAFAGSGILIPRGFERGATAPMRAYGHDEDGPLAPDVAGGIAERLRGVRTGHYGAMTDTLYGVSGPDAPVTALLRADHAAPRAAGDAALILVNPALDGPAEITADSLGPLPTTALRFAGDNIDVPSSRSIRLAPGAVLRLGSQLAPAVVRTPRPDAVHHAVEVPRIVIEGVTPAVDGGRFPVKEVLGRPVDVSADIFIDGHDTIAARILWRAVDESEWREAPMLLEANDRWRGRFMPSRLGRHVYTVEAWRDAYGSWRDEIVKKRAAGQPLDLELKEGLEHLRQIAAGAHREDREALAAVIAAAEAEPTVEAAISSLLAPDAAHSAAACDPKDHRARHPVEMPLAVERLGAAYANWYELFPRSETHDARQHGTLLSVIERLPAIRDMGFDVLYFPPIHPIGRKNRKGRNNALVAGPDEPGSPYAIGSEDGGHDSIHPELGTLEDFRRLRDAAAAHGLEIALDFAIQCSPDHPWLKEHPEWFAWRPDGSIRYAENPPKRYEDIVNVDFYAEGAIPGLWLALRDIVLTWAEEGVRLFRVDNPHTKPLPFWEWMIEEVSSRYPDVAFLAEAFTRPKMMYRLAKVGFSQSYTYFTWRNDKNGLTDYLSELTRSPARDFFRPHFFVNTPDINPIFLQTSGRPGFLIRAALATTLSGLWGMYSGFELCEADPLPGREEYKDSEKYEIKRRDWTQGGHIINEITQLNRIRKNNPALQTHLGLTFYNAFDDRIIYYGKATPTRDNVILVFVNLDPFSPATFSFELPLWEWGLGDSARLMIDDLLNGQSSVREGKLQWLTLDPHHQPYAIWRVRPVGGH